MLDLRGNPGGLLDQAAKVVDVFVNDGPIVATVGNPSEGREEKVAHEENTEPGYPLAVLVNGSSASASEIVTGALKNHDRAVIIGETTFGKGSVQLVFPDLPDKAALKLTIAQYLTEPGDVSIQGVGVTPDIQLDPMTADPLEMDLTADSGGIKERDLSRALSNVRAKDGGRPLDEVKYDLPIKDRLEMRERGGDLDDNFELDFPIQFSRGFLAHVQPGKRSDEVRQARQFIADTRRAEVDKVAEELKGIGVDWNDAPADVPTEMCIRDSADAVLGRIRDGQRFDVILCDLMMPHMTGMDLHDALLEIAPDQAKVMIFVTGGAFTSRAREFLDRVPNGSIEKPFNSASLLASVGQVIR